MFTVDGAGEAATVYGALFGEGRGAHPAAAMAAAAARQSEIARATRSGERARMSGFMRSYGATGGRVKVGAGVRARGVHGASPPPLVAIVVPRNASRLWR
jgi:hypothetical protein